MPGDITVFYTSPINDYHMMCGSWDMKPDTEFFLSFWTIFWPFNSLKQDEKLQFQKNEKNTLRYHHCTQLYQKSWSSAILFLTYGTWRMGLLFFILDYFLPFYSSSLHRPLHQPEKSKFQKHFKKKKEKTHGDIILHMYTRNYD